MTPLILVTNDDGIQAKGLGVLAGLMAELGDVLVMAPETPQSGQSNAITSASPLRFRPVDREGRITRYACTGTPTDCVKMALEAALPAGRQPDLLVSGINHGSNAAINVIYSGTMGAVFEGCECGIPSIGFSLTDHGRDADFTGFAPYVSAIARRVLTEGLPRRVCLNVNAPTSTLRGVRVVRQSDGYWTKGFERRTDPYGRDYYWMTGKFVNSEPQATDTDEWALAQGYVSIVPTRIDLTDYGALQAMKGWEECPLNSPQGGA